MLVIYAFFLIFNCVHLLTHISDDLPKDNQNQLSFIYSTCLKTISYLTHIVEYLCVCRLPLSFSMCFDVYLCMFVCFVSWQCEPHPGGGVRGHVADQAVQQTGLPQARPLHHHLRHDPGDQLRVQEALWDLRTLIIIITHPVLSGSLRNTHDTEDTQCPGSPFLVNRLDGERKKTHWCCFDNDVLYHPTVSL